jgi:hypothetical protein
MVQEEQAIWIKPIRKKGWLPEGHDGEVRFTGTEEWIAPQMDLDRRQLKTGLTEEDEIRLEKALNLKAGTLSKYNKDFWGKFFIKLPKEGKKLYKDNPTDELEYRVAMAHSRIANSESEKMENYSSADYVMTSEEQEAKVDNLKLKVKREAFKLLGKMTTEEMREVLIVAGKRPGGNASVDFVEAKAGELAEENSALFTQIAGDPDLKTKVLISNAVAQRVLRKVGSRYMLQGGDEIGFDLESTIQYLADPSNQNVLINIKAQLEHVKK